MGPELDLRRVAEERLGNLRSRGVVTGLSVVRRDGTQRLLVGVTTPADPTAPDYNTAELDATRAQLRQALADIPFNILGEPLNQVVPAPAAALPEASRFPAAGAQQDPPDATPHPAVAPPATASPAVASLIADLDDLRGRVLYLERQMARRSSADTITAFVLLAIIGVALLLIFSPDLQSMAATAVAWARAQLESLLRSL